jgi:hypothetical protein
MNLLLSEPLPLRTTRMLGDYAVDAVLAHRWGDLTRARFNLLQLTPTQWFAADHPMEITDVFIDAGAGAERTAGWNYAVESDAAGHSWTVVNLAAAAPVGALVSAAGRGKLSPKTGALMENPAEIIEDRSRIAGRADIFPALRAECAAAGIRIAGSLEQPISSRASFDLVTESIGAIWTPQTARLYPTSAISGPVLDLTIDDVGDLDVSTSLVDTGDVLRLAYDVADATGKAQHSIELTASPQRYGGLAVELTMPMLRSPANAEAIGRPTLERMAGERYDVAFSSSRTDIRPCSRWRLVAHPAWPFDGDDPVLMILSVEVSPDSNSAQVTAETILARPNVTVTAHSLALPDTSEGAAEIAFKNGVLTLTLLDKDSKPLAGARVALDGSAAKTTDGRGIVTFNTTVGAHKLAIDAAGYTSQIVPIKL